MGESVPGVHISVNWPGGSDDFYTGFKPEIDAGYADFRMQPQEVYRVELIDVKSEAAENVGGDAGDICPELPENVHPSWQIVFQLPEK
jgi:hypothetical protein